VTTATASATSEATQAAPREDPSRIYRERRDQRQQAAALLDRKFDRLGQARVLVVALGLVLTGVVFFGRFVSPWWLIVPAVAFLVLLVRYAAVARELHRARRAVRFYTRGLERLEDQWAGKGDSGQQYFDEKHLYGPCLDLFGAGSLFERLCTARTRVGQDALAHWLQAPATPEEVRARQAAVAELRPRLDLREDVALLGAELPPADFRDVVAWGQSPPSLLSWRLNVLATSLALLNVGTLFGGLFYDTGWLPFAIALLVSAIVGRSLSDHVRKVLAPVEHMAHDLMLLSHLLSRLEQELYAAPLLQRQRAALDVAGKPPSRQIGDLAWLVDWLSAPHNQIFGVLAPMLMWRTHLALAFERWRVRSGPVIGRWLEAIGVFEALGSLAAYAYENPEDPFPEIITGPACFDGEALGHPLLPRAQCVCNDVHLGEPARVLVVSGSNMSGKSTLLRTVGTNTVLALAGAPVRARRLRLTPLTVGGTLRIQDSLLAGRSRFFAEITRIREILDRTQGPLPVLFLLDELFHGTNSHDRGIGAEAVIRRLLEAGAIGLVTTHDLALTHITERLGPAAQNVHFADEFVNGRMHFDYRIRPGVVPHSNALALMRAVGLGV
jgi:hypothetical protein